MNDYEAVIIAEGIEEADEDRTREAWQYLVDTGLAWKLQGWFGRTAYELIQAGIIRQKGAKDE